jgi:hypothetical protein
MAITDAAGSALRAPLAPRTWWETLHLTLGRWSVGQARSFDSTLVHARAGVWLSKIPPSMRTFG